MARKSTTYTLLYFDGETEQNETFDFGFEHNTPAEAINRAVELMLTPFIGTEDIIVRCNVEDE